MAFALQPQTQSRIPDHCRRYRLCGQMVLRLLLRPGDTLILSGSDPLQGVEIIRCDDVSAPALTANDSTLALTPVVADGTLSLLEQGDSRSLQARQQLQDWQVAGHLSDVLSIPAETIMAGCTLTAHREQTLVVVAPAAPMAVDSQIAPGEVEIGHGSTRFAGNLPEPLAPPVQDLHIPDSTARAYTVKAGQWIQVIDVEGKQSSDFIAFDLDAVEAARRGEISPHDIPMLDAVATRTMMGHSLPTPGLHSRFYDQNLKIMLEVVQDTVGRHDSFMLACTPRFYEDAGYFGHASCTDNFNTQLRDWQIAPRAGWPAINFFFNTTVSDCGAVYGEEPWSRPGDYVLMQAQRDLLCLSSACPDDVDSANGWCPTDIHVRVYDAEQTFPRSVAWRDIPEELPRMTQQTGFHSRTSALTTHFGEYKGFWLADEYSGWGATAEYLACRERVAMIDLTALRKFEVVGPDAERLLQLALTRNVRRLSVGEISYTALCHVTGGMIDDGTVFRMGPQAFRLVTGDSFVCTWLKQLASEHQFAVRVQESTSQLHNVAVQGPNSRELLSQLIWTPEHQPDIADLAWFHFTIGRLGGESGQPVMVSRTGYTGELGFEVWTHPDDAPAIWDAIWEAGQAFDIAPMGLLALDMLRIEAGLIFAGYEFCPQTSPYEAGIGFTVPMKTKEEDFIGRAALARQAPESRQKLVGLLIDSTETVSHGDEVYFPLAKGGRFPVGVVTSATFSPLLKQQIALCRVAPDAAAPGTDLEVGQLDGVQKRIPAMVTTTPFYDPERTRVRS
ncbi:MULTISPECIES: DUF1989 domain-containing protein [unclassified Oceanobacter]|uniref:DUF1989 domain-containing protein n=2 Tax=Gammaproteobacteria TaxID=1236 RepID=UPI0026E39383|nr:MULTISPECIES: DUF1989 domain-containing protein [unclassified Oceanobacter]MDO6682108.1 DUF1989 domain-containing protein [Oceanobacter sp. 5_MG-2023]MDP2505496.1 DUF1989 domain-containing protein [Oceanobacter sp. 3_MG-2023]